MTSDARALPGSRISEGNKKEDQLGDKLRHKLRDKLGTGRQKLGNRETGETRPRQG